VAKKPAKKKAPKAKRKSKPTPRVKDLDTRKNPAGGQLVAKKLLSAQDLDTRSIPSGGDMVAKKLLST
jgi:hypothetical protein